MDAGPGTSAGRAGVDGPLGEAPVVTVGVFSGSVEGVGGAATAKVCSGLG